MNRPMGWHPNPQAMAAVSKRQDYMGHELLSSPVDGDTWLTPRYILSCLGSFDLDPCAAESNPGWVGPGRRFTIKDDGLRQPWSGRVFMNPPFSHSAIWIVRHAEHGQGISLVAASVESRVWRDVVWKRAKGILLLHGRTRFANPDGSLTTGRPLRSIALIGWSDVDALILRSCPLAGVFLNCWDQR